MVLLVKTDGKMERLQFVCSVICFRHKTSCQNTSKGSTRQDDFKLDKKIVIQ